MLKSPFLSMFRSLLVSDTGTFRIASLICLEGNEQSNCKSDQQFSDCFVLSWNTHAPSSDPSISKQ